MTSTTAPSSTPTTVSLSPGENWLRVFDQPSPERAAWLAAYQAKLKRDGELLRARLCSAPFYAKRAAECKARTGSEAPYWESLVTPGMFPDPATPSAALPD